MTENEFDLMDELYFVQPFQYLKEALGWEDDLILSTLQSLHQSGYVKCLKSPDDEIFENVNLALEGRNFYYLATKNGLMAHNTL